MVVLQSFWRRELVALLYLPFVCHVTVSILFLLLKISRVDLQCVIVAFPCHIRLLSTGNVIFKLIN